MEAKESQVEPRWNSTGSKGIQDGIPDGTQKEAKEAKEAKMESQMELSWKQRDPSNPRWNSAGSEGSQD